MPAPQISSWSSVYVPTGTPVRYRIDETGDADIRLILGDADQVELTLTAETASTVTTNLQEALATRRG